MYIPTQFEEKRQDVLIQWIEQHAFASLITYVDGELEANHLPFEYDAEKHTLLAHIAKANPLYKALRQAIDVLVVFHIDQAYVSPNWYPSKLEHHQAVPTWNYIVIHVRGNASLIEDQKQLRGILAKLTRRHEASQSKPWKMTDAPFEYLQNELNHIVGLQIEIQSMIGKFKLSQNRTIQDASCVAEALSKQGHVVMSELMFKQLQERTT